MISFDEQVLQHVRALKAIREKFLAAPNRKAALAGLPKLESEDYAAVVESWPKDYDRILNGESATMLAMDAPAGSSSLISSVECRFAQTITSTNRCLNKEVL